MFVAGSRPASVALSVSWFVALISYSSCEGKDCADVTTMSGRQSVPLR